MIGRATIAGLGTLVAIPVLLSSVPSMDAIDIEGKLKDVVPIDRQETDVKPEHLVRYESPEGATTEEILRLYYKDAKVTGGKR
ncbi:MAG: hypothetical protein AB1325_14075 [Nitrospirota bacterium]